MEGDVLYEVLRHLSDTDLICIASRVCVAWRREATHILGRRAKQKETLDFLCESVPTLRYPLGWLEWLFGEVRVHAYVEREEAHRLVTQIALSSMDAFNTVEPFISDVLRTWDCDCVYYAIKRLYGRDFVPMVSRIHTRFRLGYGDYREIYPDILERAIMDGYDEIAMWILTTIHIHGRVLENRIATTIIGHSENTELLLECIKRAGLRPSHLAYLVQDAEYRKNSVMLTCLKQLTTK